MIGRCVNIDGAEDMSRPSGGFPADVGTVSVCPRAHPREARAGEGLGVVESGQEHLENFDGEYHHQGVGGERGQGRRPLLLLDWYDPSRDEHVLH